MKVTEDKPAVRVRGLPLNQLLQLDEFGARLIPVWAAVTAPLPLARPDVNLRVDGNLTETHDETEHFGLTALLVLKHAKAPLDNALDATVELSLFRGLKVEHMVHRLGLVRQTTYRVAKVSHLAAENSLRDDPEELLGHTRT